MCICVFVSNSFTDVYAGWPGSTSSAAVLASSDLYLKAEDRPDGYLFPREVSVQPPSPSAPPAPATALSCVYHAAPD